jgi:hypothetical protein
MKIAFADIKDSDGTDVDFVVAGISGHDIDHTDRAGQVTLYITGREGVTLLYETVVDLELPLARVFAAAVLRMVDWVEAQDRDNRARKLA